jgi:hypothetical protein
MMEDKSEQDKSEQDKSETDWLKVSMSKKNFDFHGLAEFDMSEVSFANSDITGVRFSDKVKWATEKPKQGREKRFTVNDEIWFLEEMESNNSKKESNEEYEAPSLDAVISVYRNLRENYEFRLRYDEAGQFFIKEMELKRKYREALTISPIKRKLWLKLKLKGNNDPIPNIENVLKQNGPLIRNFSLNGLYYHFSRYGESIWRPTAIGAITVGLSTLLWLTQSNPTLEPSFLAFNQSSSNISNFTGAANFTNPSHLLKSFERSFAGFLPLLPMSSDIKVGIIDYIVKIFGGGLTFVLLTIALRRKFERKYTR